MSIPFGFTCSRGCLTLKAFSLLDCKLLMMKPHLTSIYLNRQFLIYTSSFLIGMSIDLLAHPVSFKGLILYLKVP